LKRLAFFPTPYPDEILYSVLCRYHIRCGIPNARQTNLTLWGSIYGKKLYLPDGLEDIAAQIPKEAGHTAESIIRQNTIFPLLKPFLAQSRSDKLLSSMKTGNPNIYSIIGFPKVFTLQHRYLRYCLRCIDDDIKTYGEPYWHRIHQVPGVYICPAHSEATIDSAVELNELRREYYPLLPMQKSTVQSFGQGIADRLQALSEDVAWLLFNGYELGNYENSNELYDNWLRVKGYRDYHGKTSQKKVAQDLADFYGLEFLALLGECNYGICTKIKRIFHTKESFQHPLYHLLLIRLLSGSAERFFAGSQEKPPEYLPFGEPPYPCRNYVCEYHLQDVIAEVRIRRVHATPYATFSCPHCGYAYNRKGNVPKEQQYTGQIRTVDYGWRWERTVKSLLIAGESPYRVARDFHCDVRTILEFGIKLNIFPPERQIKSSPYIPVAEPQEKPNLMAQRNQYRLRWQAAIAANPMARRTELRIIDSKAQQWLSKHDWDWYDQNSPPSKKAVPMWADSDDVYLERVKTAVQQIRDSPGKPGHISVSAIGRKAGITKPAMRLMSDMLPKTKAYVTANIETLEEWQKRKIKWAVQQMRERGEVMTVYKIRHAARIEDRGRKLDSFIIESMEGF